MTTGNEVEKRSVRKLTVKNFSVIKDAELEFGKITVLIGPQASGKSLLCKLAYFFGREAIELAFQAILRESSFEDFTRFLLAVFATRFSDNTQLEPEMIAEFKSGLYSIRVTQLDFPNSEELKLKFSDEFEATYKELLDTFSQENLSIGLHRNDSQDAVRIRLNMLLSEGFIFDTYYIPAGRAFFTSAALGMSALRNPGIDPLISEFATTIAWNTNKISLSSEDAKVALWGILNKMVEIAQGHVEGSTDSPIFVTNDHRRIPFPLLSSGTQELLPLFNVLSRLASEREKQVVFIESQEKKALRYPMRNRKLVYLEEPEAHLFPQTQYELVQLFAWFSNEPSQDFSWVITTHSPYILTAFNNLIEAAQVSTAKPDLISKVDELIPERYWVKNKDFKAYAIEDGILKSIVAEDTGLVSANYLDQVSETIGAEFDELLRLGYVES